MIIKFLFNNERFLLLDLVRWIHPVEGIIPPNEFITLFEKSGFIVQLDSQRERDVIVSIV